MDTRGTITRAVDSDGTIRKTLMDDPMRPPPPVVTTPVEALPEHTIAAPAETAALSHHVDAPAFIPPEVAEPVPAARAAPAFIPPEAAAHTPVHGA